MDEMHTRTRQNEETRNERRAQNGIDEVKVSYIAIIGKCYIWGITVADTLARLPLEGYRDTRRVHGSKWRERV